MHKPARVCFDRFAGRPLPAGVKMVAPPSKFGNPYPVCEHRDRQLATDQFRQLLAGMATPGDLCSHVRTLAYPDVGTIRQLLGGYDLACTCRPGVPCHADVLLHVANGGTL